MKSKKLLSAIILSLALFSIACLYLIFSGDSATTQKQYVKINGKKIFVEIADTPATQSRGLSNHAPLSRNQGMLFIFPNRQIRTFWMKEMLFPLDIIWIDNDRIVKISEKLPAEGSNPISVYSSVFPVDHVLEVNAGWSESAGIRTGDLIEYNL